MKSGWKFNISTQQRKTPKHLKTAHKGVMQHFLKALVYFFEACDTLLGCDVE